MLRPAPNLQVKCSGSAAALAPHGTAAGCVWARGQHEGCRDGSRALSFISFIFCAEDCVSIWCQDWSFLGLLYLIIGRRNHFLLTSWLLRAERRWLGPVWGYLCLMALFKGGVLGLSALNYLLWGKSQHFSKAPWINTKWAQLQLR